MSEQYIRSSGYVSQCTVFFINCYNDKSIRHMFSANRRDFKCSKINLSPHGQSNTLWQATCTGRLGLGRCWQCLRYRFYVFLCQQIPAQYPEGPMSFYIPSLSSLSNSTRPSCILFCYHPLVSAISAADSLLQPF